MSRSEASDLDRLIAQSAPIYLAALIAAFSALKHLSVSGRHAARRKAGHD
jgi:hypothetical protein